jgi:hypothetical protein
VAYNEQSFDGATYSTISADEDSFKTEFEIAVADQLRDYGVSSDDVNVTSVTKTNRRRSLLGSDTIKVSYSVTFRSYDASDLSSFLSTEMTSTSFIEMLQTQTHQSDLSSSSFSYSISVTTQLPSGNQHAAIPCTILKWLWILN